MTQLLVSVRNADEAGLALDAGAGLIDVKEPSRGPLGMPDPSAVRGVVAVVGGRVAISIALGELLEISAPVGPIVPAGVGYAKLGLSGCGDRRDWVERWEAVLETCPPGVRRVAVVYADWQASRCPAPEMIVAAASNCRCQTLLVDTFDKSKGRLLDLWPLDDLGRFVERVRSAGMAIVLAGSIDLPMVTSVLSLKPDWIAVRGAACRGGREGQLDFAKTRYLVEFVERGIA